MASADRKLAGTNIELCQQIKEEIPQSISRLISQMLNRTIFVNSPRGRRATSKTILRTAMYGLECLGSPSCKLGDIIGSVVRIFREIGSRCGRQIPRIPDTHTKLFDRYFRPPWPPDFAVITNASLPRVRSNYNQLPL